MSNQPETISPKGVQGYAAVFVDVPERHADSHFIHGKVTLYV